MRFDQHSKERGSAPIAILAIGIGLAVLIFAGFQALVFAGMRQEHKAFRNALELRIQSLSTNSLPETQETLSRDIYAMLDKLEARYEPHHVQIQPGGSSSNLDVQVWYSRPNTALLLPGAKHFYAHIQQAEVPPQLVQAPLPTPMPTAPPEPEQAEEMPEIKPEIDPTPVPTPTVTVIKNHPAKHLTDKNFIDEVTNSPLPVMVYFWAPWCGYCRKTSPSVDQASSTFFGEMRVYKLNIDRQKTTAAQFGVRAVPAFIFFNNGKTLEKKTGYRSKKSLFAQIRKHLEDAGN